MAFRDDREALLGRIRSLEEDLATAKLGPRREEIERTLEALRVEVARAKERVEGERGTLEEIGERIESLRASVRGREEGSRPGRRRWRALALGLIAAGAGAAWLIVALSEPRVVPTVVAAPPLPARHDAAPCPEAVHRAWSAQVAPPAPESAPPDPFGYPDAALGCLEGRVYRLRPGQQRLPDRWDDLAIVRTVHACEWNVAYLHPGPERVEPGTDFGVRFAGKFGVAKAGHHLFRVASDDGARLLVDGRVVVDNDGIHPLVSTGGGVDLSAGDHALVLEYFQGPGSLALEVHVAPPDCGEAPFSLRRPPSDASFAPSPCPDGSRHVVRSDTEHFCLFEGVVLPVAEEIGHYCTYLADGYFGFSWKTDDRNRDYRCPAGMRASDNGSGGAFCIAGAIPAPPEGWRREPYCHRLHDGVIGYRLVRNPG